jgi:hypothetical protein
MRPRRLLLAQGSVSSAAVSSPGDNTAGVPGAENAKSASSERPLWLEASDKSEEFDRVRPDMAGRRFGERNDVVFRERAKLVMAAEVMCR